MGFSSIGSLKRSYRMIRLLIFDPAFSAELWKRPVEAEFESIYSESGQTHAPALARYGTGSDHGRVLAHPTGIEQRPLVRKTGFGSASKPF